MNNYASIEYNNLDNRLKSYIKELIQYKKLNIDSKELKKKYNITNNDNNKIKKYMIEKKYFPSIEFRNDDKYNNNNPKKSHSEPTSTNLSTVGNQQHLLGDVAGFQALDHVGAFKESSNIDLTVLPEDGGLLANLHPQEEALKESVVLARHSLSTDNHPHNNVSCEIYDNRLYNHIDKKKNNIKFDRNNFIYKNYFNNIDNIDNVYNNPQYFDDSKTLKKNNQKIYLNNDNVISDRKIIDETFFYKYPLYPASHQLDFHVKKHENGGKKIINSMNKYNEIYNENMINILKTNELIDNIPNISKLINIDVENEFKKGLPSRAFINDKRNKEYDNPIEHYFSYIDNDIQDPNHVVMEYPKSTRLSNKQHMQKFNM